MMKIYLNFILIFISSSSLLFCQERDTRAELNIEGGNYNISVSNDEKLFLTTSIGNIYRSDNIDSSWYYTTELEKNDSEYARSNIRDIYFFNKDTAIILGYISGKADYETKNGYYFTQDCGENWEFREFEGNLWVYDAYVNSEGLGWMGGSDGHIYHTSDYGMNWRELKSPYNSISRMHSIFMQTSEIGISGANNNQIFQTSDNWRTFEEIQTPLDKETYVSTDEFANDRIEKVVFWKDYIVVHQGLYTYYSKRDIIEWQKFNMPIMKFELNEKTNELVAISSKNEILLYSNPIDYKNIAKGRMNEYLIDFEIMNSSIFALGASRRIYKISEDVFVENYLFTEDHEIKEPPLVVQGRDKEWGANGNNLYIRPSNSSWERAALLDINVKQINVLKENEIVVLSDKNENYKYNLDENSLKAYLYENPLQNFLKHKIDSVIIFASHYGCFNSEGSLVKFVSNKQRKLSTSSYMKLGSNEPVSINYDKEFMQKDIINILEELNENPYELPNFNAFNITQSDKDQYLEYADNEFIDNEEKKVFFMNFLTNIERIEPVVVNDFLKNESSMWSTSGSMMSFQIFNSNNEGLLFYVEDNWVSKPWHLPWLVSHNNMHFKCYSLDFSRFISSILPTDFLYTKAFSNVDFLIKLANYNYDLQKD